MPRAAPFVGRPQITTAPARLQHPELGDVVVRSQQNGAAHEGQTGERAAPGHTSNAERRGGEDPSTGPARRPNPNDPHDLHPVTLVLVTAAAVLVASASALGGPLPGALVSAALYRLAVLAHRSARGAAGEAGATVLYILTFFSGLVTLAAFLCLWGVL